MSAPTLVDARGLSCPEPVLMTQEALRAAGNAALAILVSSPTARDNVARALAAAGRVHAVTRDGEDWRFAVEAG